MYFAYGTKETDYLSRKDKRLAAAIAQIGPIEREVDTDLFAAVVHHIIGQQISMKAQATICSGCGTPWAPWTPSTCWRRGCRSCNSWA